MSWEIVKDVKAYRHAPKEPRIELTRSGRIRLNARATEELENEVIKGRDQAVILFNPQTKQVAVAPIEDEKAEEYKAEVSNERVRVFKLRQTKKGISIPAKPMFDKIPLELPEDVIATDPVVEEHPEYGKLIAFSVENLLPAATQEVETAQKEAAATTEPTQAKAQAPKRKKA